MAKRHFTHGESTYFCHACHRETRDTGKGEGGTGLCALCYEINEWENLHFDEDHEGEFAECKTCSFFFTPAQQKHLPYYVGEKSYPTI